MKAKTAVRPALSTVFSKAQRAFYERAAASPPAPAAGGSGRETRPRRAHSQRRPRREHPVRAPQAQAGPRAPHGAGGAQARAARRRGRAGRCGIGGAVLALHPRVLHDGPGGYAFPRLDLHRLALHGRACGRCLGCCGGVRRRDVPLHDARAHGGVQHPVRGARAAYGKARARALRILLRRTPGRGEEGDERRTSSRSRASRRTIWPTPRRPSRFPLWPSRVCSRVDWRLALALVIPIVAAFILMGRALATPEGAACQAAMRASGETLEGTTVEYVHGMSVVKVFNRSLSAFRRFEADAREYVGNIKWADVLQRFGHGRDVRGYRRPDAMSAYRGAARLARRFGRRAVLRALRVHRASVLPRGGGDERARLADDHPDGDDERRERGGRAHRRDPRLSRSRRARRAARAARRERGVLPRVLLVCGAGRAAGARRRELSASLRQHHGPRGPFRRRQVDHRGAHPAVLRRG